MVGPPDKGIIIICVQPCEFRTTIERGDGDGRVSGSGTKASPLFSHVSFGLGSAGKSDWTNWNVQNEAKNMCSRSLRSNNHGRLIG